MNYVWWFSPLKVGFFGLYKFLIVNSCRGDYTGERIINSRSPLSEPESNNITINQSQEFVSGRLHRVGDIVFTLVLPSLKPVVFLVFFLFYFTSGRYIRRGDIFNSRSPFMNQFLCAFCVS